MNTETETWRTGFVMLGKIIANLFQEKKITIESLASSCGLRSMLSRVYATMIIQKMMMPIEEIPVDIRDDLRGMVEQYCANLSREEKLKFAKSVMVIENLLQFYM